MILTRKILLQLALLTACIPAFAQPPARPQTIADTLQSVQINDDRVTFKFYAPKASAITVSGDFLMGKPPAALVKGDDGVWTYTTDPLPRESYTYNFTVDGVMVLDTRSPTFKENPNSLFNYFVMPGAETDFLSVKNVPHGRVEEVMYHSTSLNMERRVHVYLPPNYESIKGKLPVLYLLHGAGDNDISWTSAGQVNFILDNLYAAGKLKNFIVVMPAGHIPGVTSRMMQFAIAPDLDPFSKDFLNDLMPFVEKNYNVSTKREDRAIAGFSMGGVQALNLALGNPDKFDYLVAMSTGYFPAAIQSIEDHHGAVLENVAAHPFKQFLIGRGKDDTLVPKNSDATMAMLTKYHIAFRYQEMTGTHSFVFSRKFLEMAFPLLFR